jgi:hypothetical protein
MSKKDLIPFTKAETRFIEKMVEKRDKAEVRYPLLTGLAATFGFVSVLYGFEKMIDSVQLFVDHPSILLVTGLIILAVTGSVYRKLN